MTTDLFERPSTADTGSRNDLDFYETPVWMTNTLLHHHPLSRGLRVVEPCAGDGAIARVLQRSHLHVVTNDIDQRHQTDHHEDATLDRLWASAFTDGVDFVITNPPFNEAFRILQHAYSAARVGVAMLLRKTFLEPTRERGPWLAAHPPSRIIGLPRHSFRGKGSDSVSADWVIWQKPGFFDVAWMPAIVIDTAAKERG